MAHACYLNSLCPYSGEYIYLPSTAPLHPGYKAILISQIIPLYDLPDLCFTFWYYMWGSRAGTLNISYHIQGAFSDEPVITFTRTGNQGNNWIQGFMDIPQPWNAITVHFFPCPSFLKTINPNVELHVFVCADMYMCVYVHSSMIQLLQGDSLVRINSAICLWNDFLRLILISFTNIASYFCQN